MTVVRSEHMRRPHRSVRSAARGWTGGHRRLRRCGRRPPRPTSAAGDARAGVRPTCQEGSSASWLSIRSRRVSRTAPGLSEERPVVSPFVRSRSATARSAGESNSRRGMAWRNAASAAARRASKSWMSAARRTSSGEGGARQGSRPSSRASRALPAVPPIPASPPLVPERAALRTVVTGVPPSVRPVGLLTREVVSPRRSSPSAPGSSSWVESGEGG